MTLRTGPLYLTVTCTVFGVRLCSTRIRIFWGTTSGFIPVFSAIWFDSGCMSVLVYEACFPGDSAPRAVFLRGFQALVRCIMAVYVAVHKTAEFRSCSSSRSSTLLSWRICRSSWSRLFRRSFRLQFPDCRCPCCACRADSQVPLWSRLSCSHSAAR